MAIDEIKAKAYFQKAANLGFDRAKTELAQPRAENAKPSQSQTVSIPLAEEVENAAVEIPKKLKKVKQKITKGNISGIYTGHLLRYDWSGQNVISKTIITVSFDQDNKKLTGIWSEKEGDSIAFNATIKQKMIDFEKSKIERIEHFSKNNPKKYEFREAKLQVIENQEDVYIVGNLQLYDIREHENEKPMYIILKLQAEETIIDPTQAVVSKMVVYPNPVTADSFKLSFDLKEQTPISIKIYDLTGLLKHEQQLITSGTGLQEQTIPFTAPTGNYILNLYYNNQVIRTILIKK